MEQKLHYDELAALADLLAAECRFELWTYDRLKVKHDVTEKGIDILLERGDVSSNLENAMRAFAADRKSSELVRSFVEATRVLNDRSLPGDVREVTVEN